MGEERGRARESTGRRGRSFVRGEGKGGGGGKRTVAPTGFLPSPPHTRTVLSRVGPLPPPHFCTCDGSSGPPYVTQAAASAASPISRGSRASTATRVSCHTCRGGGGMWPSTDADPLASLRHHRVKISLSPPPIPPHLYQVLHRLLHPPNRARRDGVVADHRAHLRLVRLGIQP